MTQPQPFRYGALILGDFDVQTLARRLRYRGYHSRKAIAYGDYCTVVIGDDSYISLNRYGLTLKGDYDTLRRALAGLVDITWTVAEDDDDE